MTAPSIRLLLVEDNPDDADVFQELLREADARGFSLAHVESLREARAHLDRRAVDVVLLDLSLPDCHGHETVARVLAHAPSVPIVVLTGLDDERLGMEAVQAGAQDYLVKGQVDGRLLRRCVRYAIERHRLFAEKTEDAAVWSALATVGEELIASIGTRALLGRLCRVTTEALGCDFTHAWIRDATAEAYLPLAANTADEWERIRQRQISFAAAAKLPGDAAVHLMSGDLEQESPASASPPGSRVLYMTLRRGDEIVGLQGCGWRDRAASLTPRQERIANGLVHLASLALENARLIEELEHSNMIKTYFAATMSHELRSTLGVIVMLSELGLRDLSLPLQARQRQTMQLVNERAMESLQLIQATLELTRSEVAQTQPATQEICVRDLVDQVIRETALPVQKSNLRLEWQVASTLPALRSDPVKLKMVLKNLIANAIKFTEQGRVSVEVTAADGGLQFAVADTGIGIPPEEIPVLFEPFRQGYGTLSRHAGGAGLGLYIVRRLVEMLGGTIAVDSVPGGGSTFSVRLPLLPPSAAAR